MKILLIVLLSLAFNTSFAAESITHNGKKGVFIEEEKAKEILKILEVDYPASKKQIELQQTQINLQKELITILESRVKNSEDIAKKWQESFEINQKIIAKLEEKNDFKHYIYIGSFIVGTLAGIGVMYGSSVLLNNIR